MHVFSFVQKSIVLTFLCTKKKSKNIIILAYLSIFLASLQKHKKYFVACILDFISLGQHFQILKNNKTINIVFLNRKKNICYP
jgi:hypothetical protein